MENNLFASLETSVKQEKDNSYFDKMKEMRIRSEIKDLIEREQKLLKRKNPTKHLFQT
jgi:hypothetical protein